MYERTTNLRTGKHPYNELMNVSTHGSRAEQRRKTEARILEAAAGLFLAAGYERTTIRAVAAEAGVQAGLVMHYFGSKQNLYQHVIEAAPVPDVSGPDELLASLAQRLDSESFASLAVLRSMLTTPDAAEAVIATAERYQGRIAQSIAAPDAALRAAIIDAITLGLMVSRHLIKSGTLATADGAAIIELLRPCILELTNSRQSRPELDS